MLCHMKDKQFTLWPPNADPRFIVQGFSLFEIRPGLRRWVRSCFNRNAWCQSRNSIGSGASGTDCASGTAHYANTLVGLGVYLSNVLSRTFHTGNHKLWKPKNAPCNQRSTGNRNFIYRRIMIWTKLVGAWFLGVWLSCRLNVPVYTRL